MCPSPLSPPPMPPGEYLARRRKAAGWTHADVARCLAAMPWPLSSGQIGGGDLAAIEALLTAVEEGRTLLTLPQVEQLRNCFRFDLDVYLQLVDLEAAGSATGLPVPQLCADCGCSWHDPCLGSGFGGMPCHWAQEDLCSRCELLRQAQAELVASAMQRPPFADAGVPS